MMMILRGVLAATVRRRTPRSAEACEAGAALPMHTTWGHFTVRMRHHKLREGRCSRGQVMETRHGNRGVSRQRAHHWQRPAALLSLRWSVVEPPSVSF